MEQNKTAKYFKYAFGEIILVVIGILIALQINNWNELNKNKAKEQLFISGLLNDLDNQKTLLKEQLTYETSKINEADRCLQFVKEYPKENSVDSIYLLIKRLNPRKTLVVIDPTFEELKATGSLRLISNPALRKTIISFYQNLELQTQIITNNNFNVDNIYQPFTTNNRMEFYYNSRNKLAVNLENNSPKLVRLENMLILRKSLSHSNLRKAKEATQELNLLYSQLKKNFQKKL